MKLPPKILSKDSGIYILGISLPLCNVFSPSKPIDFCLKYSLIFLSVLNLSKLLNGTAIDGL
tara:strand:- start:249 stop:434 length:186 start_codon:yes stop_codon:yes gene_type:complete